MTEPQCDHVERHTACRRCSPTVCDTRWFRPVGAGSGQRHASRCATLQRVIGCLDRLGSNAAESRRCVHWRCYCDGRRSGLPQRHRAILCDFAMQDAGRAVQRSTTTRTPTISGDARASVVQQGSAAGSRAAKSIPCQAVQHGDHLRARVRVIPAAAVEAFIGTAIARSTVCSAVTPRRPANFVKRPRR